MAKLLIVGALLVALSLASDAATAAPARRPSSPTRPRWHELDASYSFEQYVQHFSKGYTAGTIGYEQRRAVFASRLAKVLAHNSDKTQTYKRGVNMFTDMTPTEWKRFNSYRRSPSRPAPTSVVKAPAGEDPLHFSVDYRTWTNPSVLTSVKHQGSCGNCWAQSAAETIESQVALTTGLLPTLSTQQITSCTPAPAAGCNGADAVAGYNYVNSSFHGLTEEWVYPFSDFFFVAPDKTAACINTTKRFPNTKPYQWFAELTRIGVKGHVAVHPDDPQATRYALANNGPLSISVAAGNWQDYETGVFSNTNSSGGDNEWAVDHAVQMVGFGFDKELDVNYWIVRNSWSTLWGEAGYIRLFRAANPADEPCSPAEYGPVCGTSGCLNDPHFPLVYPHPGQPF